MAKRLQFTRRKIKWLLTICRNISIIIISLCNLVRKKILAACSKCDVYGALKKFEVVLIIFKNEIKKKIRMQWINIP